MEIETEVEGQPSSSRGRGKRSRASSSSAVPLDALQIILERIDGLRDVQNEQSNRLAAIQEQMNLLSAKFDSFTTQQQPLAIPVKNGENFGEEERVALKGKHHFEGEQAKNFF